MSAHETEKAVRYIGLLNSARLSGNWHEIPELVRKVDKHAPHRKCLTLTASSEAHIAAASKQRPTSASSTISNSGLLDVTPKLVQAIDQEKLYLEDAFQATVCLHHIYFLRSEWKAVVEGLNFETWGPQAAQFARSQTGLSPWTRVCMIKSRYFVGFALEKLLSPRVAGEEYEAALQLIRDTPRDVTSSAEYRIWTERLLARSCFLNMQYETPPTLREADLALGSFQTWAHHWEQIPGKGTSGSATTDVQGDIPRRQVWGDYYQLLSAILASDLLYPVPPGSPLRQHSSDVSDDDLTRSRVQLRTDLKRVETTYETLLLQETRFPKASQSNEEVENWVQQVVTNWKTMCGPSWHDMDLGAGGKEAVGRGVLDILYRAAMKTFHSTPILRHLFTVHASLAEFDLAMKAFDSYTEIVGKGKARAEKTGEHELGLDTDDIVLLTAAQAIKLLCLYGSRTEGEKALDVGKKVATWLQQQRPSSSGTVGSLQSTEASVSPEALSAAYQGIGQSQANWARLTYEPSERSELQIKALKSLRRAAAIAPEGAGDLDTALSLALVLAETQDVPAAIQVLKAALAAPPQKQQDSNFEGTSDTVAPTNVYQSNRFDRERRGLPLWHLLTLLLTARGEFDTAVKMCEAAFEQIEGFASPDGSPDDGLAGVVSHSLVDQMEGFEKEGIIQIKITQLALLETVESPAAAVDATSELLELYAHLFGDPNVGRPAVESSSTTANATATLQPSKPGGTLKSISGSILGRPKPGSSMAQDTMVGSNGEMTTEGEHGKHHKHHMPFKLRGHHAGNLNQDRTQAPLVPPKDGSHQTNTTSGHSGAITTSLSEKTVSGPEQALRPIAHNMERNKQPPPVGQHVQPPQQDLRLPAPHPAAKSYNPGPKFPTARQRRHSVSLLIDIWLYIAGLYTRAELFDDARAAADEAVKLIEGFEVEVAREGSSARAFDERGWGGGKSVSALWGDYWAERGKIAAAQGLSHDALSSFEQSLSHFPDHPDGIVGISAILLDIYEEKTPPEPAAPNMPAKAPKQRTSSHEDPSPALLNRLAARDRAYMLLSTLTKLGTPSGWDNSEAWFALSRAHELSGQIDKAKEVLWWVVELEDARPVRHWSCVPGKGWTG